MDAQPGKYQPRTLGIRPMDRDDIAQVARIERACFSVPLNETEIRRSLARKATTWVVAVDDGGEVLGFSQTSKRTARCIELLHVAVLPEVRRRAIGARLVERVLKGAIAAGCRVVFCVPETNLTAMLWLKALGIEAVGIKHDEFLLPGPGGVDVRVDGVQFCWRPGENKK